MALADLGLAAAIAFAAGTCFYPLLWAHSRLRRIGLIVLLTVVLCSPLIVPAHARFIRFLGTVIAVRIGVGLYDLHAAAEAGLRLRPLMFLAYLANPFALVIRKVIAEPRPAVRDDLLQATFCTLIGAIAIALVFLVFHVDWRHYPCAVEHCAKLISIFLVIQFLPNGIAATYRMAGIPATNFADSFFLAPTPASFWRRYNRPAAQFFHAYVFNPSGGLRRPVFATLMTFAFSGLVHEYVFDLAAGPSIIGYQMTFFMIQGLAAVATLGLRPTGRRAVPCIVLTLAFNLAAGYLFFACVNRIVPFYAAAHVPIIE